MSTRGQMKVLQLDVVPAGVQIALRDRLAIDQKLDLDGRSIESLGNLDLEPNRKTTEGDWACIETQFAVFRGQAPT